jgi:hypothetical protein
MKQRIIILPTDWKEYWTRQVSLIDNDKNKRIRLKLLIWLLTSKQDNHFSVEHTLEILNDYFSKNSITLLKQILNISQSSYLFDSDWDDNLYEMMHGRGSLINLCLKRILFNENLDIIQLDKILIWETKFF